MELKFQKTLCPYLRRVTSQIQSGEQTQEVRLTDGMPDIGRVIGCWGQVLTRGKEWHQNGISVNGGVMAWVMYLPEDGTEPRTMETWLPFQMKWDFPDTERDGTICAQPYLKSMDARSTSARKLMVRSSVSVMGTAYEPAQAELYDLTEYPEDVQILKNTYPLELPQEAGEKNFQLEEEFFLPETMPPLHKILHYHVNPIIADQKILAGKLVFKGNCMMEMMYQSENGEFSKWNTQFPFSQFADLDREYSNYANTQVIPILTGMELDRDDSGRMHMKCGISGQYIVFDRSMVGVVEDAYSPRRKLNLKTQNLKLPVRLECMEENISFQHSVPAEANRCIDLAFLPDAPHYSQEGENAVIRVPVQYQLLYTNASDSLQAGTGRVEPEYTMESLPGNYSVASVYSCKGQMQPAGDHIDLSGSLHMHLHTFRDELIPMVTQIELGELMPSDPLRPSLVMRRIGEERLWDLAKEYGSTVEAICRANSIESEPVSGKFLLIPVS